MSPTYLCIPDIPDSPPKNWEDVVMQQAETMKMLVGDENWAALVEVTENELDPD